ASSAESPTLFPTVSPTVSPTPSPKWALRRIFRNRALVEGKVLRSYNADGTSYPSIRYTFDGLIRGLRVMGDEAFDDGIEFLLYDYDPIRWRYGLVNVAAFLANGMVESIEDDVCDELNWHKGESCFGRDRGRRGGGGIRFASPRRDERVSLRVSGASIGPRSHGAMSFVESALISFWAPLVLFAGRYAIRSVLLPNLVGPNARNGRNVFSPFPSCSNGEYDSPRVPSSRNQEKRRPFDQTPASISFPSPPRNIAACGQEGRSYQDETCGIYSCLVDVGMEVTAVSSYNDVRAPPPLECRPGSGPDSFSGYWNAATGTEAKNTPYANTAGRTDVEGCCYWGRNLLLTRGACNIGKLDYYIGARAAREGRRSIYPTIDFCADPEATCASSNAEELRWTTALFEWAERVQRYDNDGWAYEAELFKFADSGMNDDTFINSVNRVFSRGCHEAGCDADLEVRMADERKANFYLILNEVFGLDGILIGGTTSQPPIPPPAIPLPTTPRPTPRAASPFFQTPPTPRPDGAPAAPQPSDQSNPFRPANPSSQSSDGNPVSVCSGKVDEVVSTNGCKSYAKCFNGMIVSHGTCLDGLLYDSTIGSCNWAMSVVCDAATMKPTSKPTQQQLGIVGPTDTSPQMPQQPPLASPGMLPAGPTYPTAPVSFPGAPPPAMQYPTDSTASYPAAPFPTVPKPVSYPGAPPPSLQIPHHIQPHLTVSNPVSYPKAPSPTFPYPTVSTVSYPFGTYPGEVVTNPAPGAWPVREPSIIDAESQTEKSYEPTNMETLIVIEGNGAQTTKAMGTCYHLFSLAVLRLLLA
ncbi:hypothetical protein ACHAWF_003913, partial [Thalassiosira exigua]